MATILYYVMPISFSLLAFFYAFFYLKAARNIENTPTSLIRSAAQGYVELKGKAKPFINQTLLGALTHTPCAWYRYTIEKYTVNYINQKPNYYWALLEEGMSSDPFLLNDGTGECIIFPEGARVIPTTPICWRDHNRNPGPPPTSFWKALLWNSWGAYRFTEYRLELEASIYCTGVFNTWNTNSQEISNLRELSQYLKEKNYSTANILSKEGLSQNENFILSAVSEQTLVRRFKLKALIFFLSFLVFLTMSVASIFPSVRQSFLQLQSGLTRNLFR